MNRPHQEFKSEEDELKYGVKTLLEAGFSIQQIERMREANRNVPGGALYMKELVGQRRHMVSELLAGNLSNSQIARCLKLSKETVNADRNHIRALYVEETLKSADVWRARLIKEQEEIRKVAIKAFEESKIKRTVFLKSDGHGEDAGSTKIEYSAGDSAFLTVAKNTLVETAKMLHLHDARTLPQAKEEIGYKRMLKDMASMIEKEKEAEKNKNDRESAIAIEATDALMEDDTTPPESRPMLDAKP